MQDQRCLVPTVLPNQLDYELLKRLIARSSHPVIILTPWQIIFNPDDLNIVDIVDVDVDVDVDVVDVDIM
ncbi:hypothetical protein ACN38_g583 [Penicillium nordicum]|uniref:Uncharacterized protein n=1 Tax=Penicillium nordicum TaxID=229535 RepID=A0A0M9WKJ7_9EURO|nr:hypothetical protein ACN38_g583 [Penicillium nordicum]